MYRIGDTVRFKGERIGTTGTLAAKLSADQWQVTLSLGGSVPVFEKEIERAPHEAVTLAELVRRYCETQDATPEAVQARLDQIAGEREVTGWMLLQCAVMDSSRFGHQVILPYGPGCTLKEVPTHPFSPRGLASDQSVVVAVAPRQEVAHA